LLASRALASLASATADASERHLGRIAIRALPQTLFLDDVAGKNPSHCTPPYPEQDGISSSISTNIRRHLITVGVLCSRQ